MNKKQWIVLGIGLIIMGILFSILSSRASNDCGVLVKDALESYKKAADSDMSVLEKQSFYPDALINSCYDKVIMLSSVSSILWGFGIIFVILGFLEDKRKRKE